MSHDNNESFVENDSNAPMMDNDKIPGTKGGGPKVKIDRQRAIGNHSFTIRFHTQEEYDQINDIIEYRFKNGHSTSVREFFFQLVEYATSDQYLYGPFKHKKT